MKMLPNIVLVYKLLKKGKKMQTFFRQIQTT